MVERFSIFYLEDDGDNLTAVSINSRAVERSMRSDSLDGGVAEGAVRAGG